MLNYFYYIVAILLCIAPLVNASEPEATPASAITTLPGFQVERLYSVPGSEQGSWVCLAFDAKGRMLASDQFGSIYRITLPPIGTKQPLQIETLKINLGHAQGLVFVGETLYAVVNDGEPYKNGLYRLRDTDGDDQFDEIKLLREIPGNGEHGPHGLTLGPDGQSLYMIAGNCTQLPNPESSRMSRTSAKDHLVSPLTDANEPYAMATGGWVAKTDLDGARWEIVAMGLRNAYDLAFNSDGELFTYDSDMEGDMGAPWYRPTRVYHLVSGGDYGWRYGSGKLPSYYSDVTPPVVDVGPGSPTGISFGYGAKFPAKYQRALFLNDWSSGNIYAVHLEPVGATYRATIEKFLTGQPLPATDLAIGPDGALYFTIGGRRVQSGLYRVSYIGKESTSAATIQSDAASVEARLSRRELEAFHGGSNPQAIEIAWPYLGDADPALRQAARIAIEHQPVTAWQHKALSETNSCAAITALVALARCGDESLQPKVLEALGRLDWSDLDEDQKLAIIRAYGLTLISTSKPEGATAASIAQQLDEKFPANLPRIDRELAHLLCYLNTSTAVAKTLGLLIQSPTQEEQIQYAMALRNVTRGWTEEQRRAYFTWLRQAAALKGGQSLAGFIKNIKADAVKTLSASERISLADVLKDLPPNAGPAVSPRPLVKEYTYDEILALCESSLRQRSYERGRRIFAVAQCAACHHFAGEGGVGGPDLTSVAGRFQLRDLLDAIVEPSKNISDQYQSTIFVLKNGQSHVGRIVNFWGDDVAIVPNLLAPGDRIILKRSEIETMTPSKTSMMPAGLLNTLQEDEILDLVAYLMSRGDRNAGCFK